VREGGYFGYDEEFEEMAVLLVSYKQGWCRADWR
jgi:hypothetical protein